MAHKLVLFAFALMWICGCSQETSELSNSDCEFAILKAIGCSDNQEFDAAFTILNPVVEIRPNDSMARMIRGTILRKSGRYPEAIADLDHVILLDPNNADAYCQRAFARQQEQKPNWQSQAMADAETLIQLRSHNPLSHIVRGTALMTQGEFKKARTEFSIAIRQNPQSYAGYGGRAGAYAELANYSKALADIKKALTLDPPISDRNDLELLARHISQMKVAARRPGNKLRFISHPF